MLTAGNLKLLSKAVAILIQPKRNSSSSVYCTSSGHSLECLTLSNIWLQTGKQMWHSAGWFGGGAVVLLLPPSLLHDLFSRNSKSQTPVGRGCSCTDHVQVCVWAVGKNRLLAPHSSPSPLHKSRTQSSLLAILTQFLTGTVNICCQDNAYLAFKYF